MIVLVSKWFCGVVSVLLLLLSIVGVGETVTTGRLGNYSQAAYYGAITCISLLVSLLLLGLLFYLRGVKR